MCDCFYISLFFKYRFEITESFNQNKKYNIVQQKKSIKQ